MGGQKTLYFFLKKVVSYLLRFTKKNMFSPVENFPDAHMFEKKLITLIGVNYFQIYFKMVILLLT